MKKTQRCSLISAGCVSYWANPADLVLAECLCLDWEDREASQKMEL